MNREAALYVHSLESLAARDGEGLRYGVFLGGCPLRCAYCHNPDTWDMQNARAYGVDELYTKIKRYQPYFRASGGGVTFSGGEPLLQADALSSLAALLRESGVPYTLDTSGSVALTDKVKELLLGADLVILDLKFASDEDYRRYTGGALSSVLGTLAFLVENEKRIWIRTVVVPGLNDSEQALGEYVKVLLPYRDKILKYELLPFHTMGFFKYEKMGKENPLVDTPPMDMDRLKALQELVNR